MSKLTSTEIDLALLELPEWKLEDGKLVRDYTFPDFASAMLFVNKVAVTAETANHHPDIDVRYNRVRVGLISHDSSGVTKRDLNLAARINQDMSIEPRRS